MLGRSLVLVVTPCRVSQEECAGPLQDISNKINSHHPELHSHLLLSIFKMAEVEVKVPESSGAAAPRPGLALALAAAVAVAAAATLLAPGPGRAPGGVVGGSAAAAS